MDAEIFTPEQRALLGKAAAEDDPELRRKLDDEFNASITPAQRARLDASVADGEIELRQQMRRVNVELSLDDPDLEPEADEPVQVSENVFVVNTYRDITAISDVLAELPDGAGTKAFWVAYKSKRAREVALKHHIQRLDVNMHSAWRQLLAVHPSLNDGPEDAVAAAFISTMAGLPDGAGTEAFVTAHHAHLSSQ